MAVGFWMRWRSAACLLGIIVVTLVSISQSSVSAAEEIVFTGRAPKADDAVELKEVKRSLPLVITTWGFVEAARAAWTVMERGGSSVDAVMEGCSTCEALRCDFSGYGGSPDEAGETTLDAMIMDGTTMNVGAVGALRSVKDAIRAARLVLDYSEHSLLVGEQASAFALSLGIPGPTNLSTADSMQMWSSWRDFNCQPNFRTNVVPDPKASCGPYQVVGKRGHASHLRCRSESMADIAQEDFFSVKGVGFSNHDTISMVVIDRERKIAVGTSTNGASHKIPGRVGDGPIAGASAYADDDVGACGATGDGDVMMRFLPCYQVVESMRRGRSPKHAARDAIRRIKQKFPSFIGAVFAVNRHGKYAGACHGWTFQYAVRGSDMDDVEIHTVNPIK